MASARASIQIPFFLVHSILPKCFFNFEFLINLHFFIKDKMGLPAGIRNITCVLGILISRRASLVMSWEEHFIWNHGVVRSSPVHF